MPLVINSQGYFDIDAFGNQKKLVDFRSKDRDPVAEIARLCNSGDIDFKRLNNGQVGAETAITNLTHIYQRVVMQRFYEVKVSEFMPVVVGQGAYMTHTTNYRVQLIGDGGFESGLTDMAQDAPRQSQSNFTVDSLTVPHKQWLKQYQYSMMEMNQLSKMQVTKSPIELKEEARKKSWDLGIQELAFLGLKGDANFPGLLNQPLVISDTATLTKALKDMTEAEFIAFTGTILGLYYNSTNSTAMPDLFIIPTADYLGLAGTPMSATAPFSTRLQYLETTLKMGTSNDAFKVKPLQYCDQRNNSFGVNRYVLTRSADEDTARLSIPIDYTTTIVDTPNGMNWYGSSFGQFTPVISNLNQYLYYLDFATPSS